jgi:protein TonB
MFATAGGIKAPRSQASFWTAIVAHAVAIGIIALLIMNHVKLAAPAPQTATVIAPPLSTPPPLPMMPKAQKMGGGGGQHDLAPVTQGHLPKFSQEPQIVPPKAPPTIPPKLAVEPTVNVQPNIKIADNKMPDLGMPNSNLKGFSLGNGSGTGIGSGTGNGVGPGSGGNMGGGVYQVGGSVRAPQVIYSVDPEFSEEARKAKFSGNVQVALIVDSSGLPKNIRVERGVGMGLDEKAVEAVRQYRFKPAMKDGKPVPVEIYVEVNFQIF